jgi:hypothetical protein
MSMVGTVAMISGYAKGVHGEPGYSHITIQSSQRCIHTAAKFEYKKMLGGSIWCE